ncbi:hypothetical protein [Candidatus Laterigemmans baculatus]|nr:hypothetical protein [Candidatus Laterigemmans baculatus]
MHNTVGRVGRLAAFLSLVQLRAVAMKMTRNHYFLLGVLLILLGIQFRMVESFVLNEPATRALARVTRSTPVASNDMMSTMMLQYHPNPTKRFAPPRWLGLALIASGTVISLHAVAIPRNGG